MKSMNKWLTFVLVIGLFTACKPRTIQIEDCFFLDLAGTEVNVVQESHYLPIGTRYKKVTLLGRTQLLCLPIPNE